MKVERRLEKPAGFLEKKGVFRFPPSSSF